jgi:tetratricopeptide (TPR) repeat protein
MEEFAMKQSLLKRIMLTCTLCSLVPMLAAPVWASIPATTASADRAVQIARQSRDRVELSGKGLHEAADTMFQEFADRTVALQELLDTRKELEAAGFLNRTDPDGAARRANINGKILTEVGILKSVCDQNLPELLSALDSFDDAVAASLVDSQATRSINSNYELALDSYLKQERSYYSRASGDAESALEAFQSATDPRQKELAQRRYKRAKQRLVQIGQRRQLYEARLKAAEMNQQVSGMIRDKIRSEGHNVPTRFREVMTGLYTAFARITPIAEVGGTGAPEIWSQIGFSNLEEMHSTLQVVDDAVGKLDGVLNDMVDDVMTGLNEIKPVGNTTGSGRTFSVEEEMEFLRKQRQSWRG